MSTLASPRSPSNSSTRLPLRASAWARVTDSQVLPTPPLPEAMASMLAQVCCRSPVSMMVASVMLLFRGEKGGGLERAEGREQARSEEHTSELQSLMRISYAVFCLKKKTNNLHT